MYCLCGLLCQSDASKVTVQSLDEIMMTMGVTYNGVGKLSVVAHEQRNNPFNNPHIGFAMNPNVLIQSNRVTERPPSVLGHNCLHLGGEGQRQLVQRVVQ
jgi:hypothetical protein